MSRRRATGATAAPAAKRAAAAPVGGLALHEAAARAQALLRDRARLLREVQKKKVTLERVRQQMARDAEAAVLQMKPLVQRHDALVAELTSLFTELLAAGRVSARARRRLVKLRRALELQGVLTPGESEASDADFDAFSADEPRRPRAEGHAQASGARADRAPQASAREVAGAEQVGQQRRSLRELFRSLVKSIHPDQARHDTERERRTAVMKEVTRAYEEGDLARLLELESTWQGEQAISDNADSLARCRELERVNRELIDQVRSLTRQIRDLKREALDASMGLSPEELAERAGRELDDLEDICRFIESFRDGKLSVAELERGPEHLFEELELVEQLFADFFAEEREAPAGRAPRRKRKA
ncbi:MAG TPA: hypothetical protein VEQ58_09150 [Polyangiaceae bacterium]|nr:hypothetical protein [Polyangiaceae bacterium]